MKLIGNYLSPYARRVAVSLNTLGMPFVLEQVFVFKDPERVRKHNPLVRVPTLILDDGETLIESYAILDAIDELAGAERRLTPAAGAERRRVMKLTAIGVGAMEKAQWAFYEGRFHPPEKVHVPWVEHNDNQVLGAFAFLDQQAREAGDNGWLVGTETMSQADIGAAVACTFAGAVRPGIDIATAYPYLADFTARCEALEAFRRAPLPET